MATITQKNIVMTLFSGKNDILSHQVRLVLMEKGVPFELEEVDGDLPKEVLDFNPYGTVPTLVDRELVLYEQRGLLEYLEERFPYPPLMPAYPVAKANNRLMLYRIQKDWVEGVPEAFDTKLTSETRHKAQQTLLKKMQVLEQVFDEFPFFMSEEFGIVDCCLIPILWRLDCAKAYEASTGTKLTKEYAQRMFARPTFLKSLTETERSLADSQF